MLKELDKLVGPDVPIRPTQGSYNSSVSASAGTHSGGGAVDLSVAGMSTFQIHLVVFLMRRLGFAAWYRPKSRSWGAHIHGVNKSCRDLPAAAKKQVTAYKNGRDGLAANNVDPDRALGAPRSSTFKSYLNNWKSRKSDWVA